MGALSRTVAVVLAAGTSSRMGPRNKLLIEDSSGVAMAARVAAACCASTAEEVVVVTGHQAGLVEHAIAAHVPPGRVRFVRVAADQGMSSSLRAGIGALDAQICAAVVCLGDMPLVTADVIDALLGAHAPELGRLIVVPTHSGKRGNPVVWDRRFFAAIMELRGDVGARGLLRAHADVVREIEVGCAGVLVDFDTEESLLF